MNKIESKATACNSSSHPMANKLRLLAKIYETPAFLAKDPSQFMHRYDNPKDQEIVAFTAACLAFGRRDQILQHVESILQNATPSPSQWIMSEDYRSFFPDNDKSFYRMYSNRGMLSFFDTLSAILTRHGSFGTFMEKLYRSSSTETLIQDKDKSASNTLHPLVPFLDSIKDAFPQNCPLVPHSRESACKKLNMFLRWMVRDNSPVDLGLWDWIPKQHLIMPMDTHVIQQSVELNLLPRNKNGGLPGGNIRTAIQLTEIVREIFPQDPLKADFALFGLGVDKD